MQIHLKQPEIELALRQFINQQGISLVGKTVEIAFTSGRKDNGLSAELTIEESVMPPDHRVAVPAPVAHEPGKPPVEVGNVPTGESPKVVFNEPEDTDQGTPSKAISLFN